METQLKLSSRESQKSASMMLSILIPPILNIRSAWICLNTHLKTKRISSSKRELACSSHSLTPRIKASSAPVASTCSVTPPFSWCLIPLAPPLSTSHNVSLTPNLSNPSSNTLPTKPFTITGPKSFQTHANPTTLAKSSLGSPANGAPSLPILLCEIPSAKLNPASISVRLWTIKKSSSSISPRVVSVILMLIY